MGTGFRTTNVRRVPPNTDSAPVAWCVELRLDVAITDLDAPSAGIKRSLSVPCIVVSRGDTRLTIQDIRLRITAIEHDRAEVPLEIATEHGRAVRCSRTTRYCDRNERFRIDHVAA